MATTFDTMAQSGFDAFAKTRFGARCNVLDNFNFNASNPGTFVSTTNIIDGPGGNVARLGTVSSGGTGTAVKKFTGLIPNHFYDVGFVLVTDENNFSPNNTLTITIPEVGGTAILISQTEGLSIVKRFWIPLQADSSGEIRIKIDADDGSGGAGTFDTHCNLEVFGILSCGEFQPPLGPFANFTILAVNP